MSTLRWRKGRNLSLCNHWTGEKKEVQVYVVNGGKEEIRVYLIIELEKRKKFSKFKFRSSLSWRKGRNSSLYRHWRKGRKKFSKFEFLSSLNYNWKKGNFRNSILCHQEIFEIFFYLVWFFILLEKRKKFSKFDFMSSLRWRKGRNSSLCNHWAGEKEGIFEIRVYVVIELEKKEGIQIYVVTRKKKEIRIYFVIELEKRKEFSKFKLGHHWAGEKEGIQVCESLSWWKERNSSLYHY